MDLESDPSGSLCVPVLQRRLATPHSSKYVLWILVVDSMTLRCTKFVCLCLASQEPPAQAGNAVLGKVTQLAVDSLALLVLETTSLLPLVQHSCISRCCLLLSSGNIALMPVGGTLIWLDWRGTCGT